MTRYVFEKVSYTAVKSLPCPVCGKRVRRQRTFINTINPFLEGSGMTDDLVAALREVSARYGDKWTVEAVLACHAEMHALLDSPLSRPAQPVSGDLVAALRGLTRYTLGNYSDADYVALEDVERLVGAWTRTTGSTEAATANASPTGTPTRTEYERGRSDMGHAIRAGVESGLIGGIAGREFARPTPAEPLDVERLHRAFVEFGFDEYGWDLDDMAKGVAREYAALAAQPTGSKP